MNHSAKDLFSDWYNQGVKKDSGVDELQNRRKSIDTLLASDELVLWVKILKIYLGMFKEESSEYQEILSVFKENDELFSVKNVYLLRLLTGCAIAEKIEDGSKYISDLLALGILTSSSVPSEDIVGELKKISVEFWIRECEKFKAMDFSENNLISQKLTAITLPQITGETHPDSASLKQYLDQLSGSLKNMLSDIGVTVQAINEIIANYDEIKQNFNALTEETNILWWLFTGYSNIAGKPLKTLSPQLLSVIIAFELNDMTKQLPGIGKIDNIIFKAFEIIKEKDSHVMKLGDIVTSVSDLSKQLLDIIPKIPLEINAVCPLLSAIDCFLEFAGNEWKPIYSKRSNINIESEISLSYFTSQLYKEFMLVRIFNKCNAD